MRIAVRASVRVKMEVRVRVKMEVRVRVRVLTVADEHARVTVGGMEE